MMWSISIPPGVAEMSITGARFGATPQRVVCSVQKPAGGPTIGACTVADSLTEDGFKVCLTGITTLAGYVLHFFVALAEVVIPQAGLGFDAWLDGVPVLVPADEQDFWSWLDGVPVLDQA